jgi:hypothetical protein
LNGNGRPNEGDALKSVSGSPQIGADHAKIACGKQRCDKHMKPVFSWFSAL